MILFQTRTAAYTAYGIAFGFLFPVISTAVESLFQFGTIGLATIAAVQANSRLLWVIDSAPFFLGLFAALAGIRQDRLHATNARLTREIAARTEVEQRLRKQNELLHDDLEYARILQRSFLPDLPRCAYADIDYRYSPVKAVGGDLVSIVEIREGGVGFFVGDVAGHGVSASLITALVKVVSDRACRKHGLEPDRFLLLVNRELMQVIPENNYLTALYGVLQRDGGETAFTFSRAAHPHPIVLRGQAGTSELILSDGVPICHGGDSRYECHTARLDPGDRLFLITDGMYDIQQKGKSSIGLAGFLPIIDAANAARRPIGETLDMIVAEADRLHDGQSVRDDRVIIGIEVR